MTNEVVKETNKNPRVISLLSVAKYSAGKKCLILYVRYVNKYIYRHKVKLDYWQCFQNFLNEISKYIFKFDLKGGYHHIAINESFQTSQIYLGFLQKIDGKVRHFVFTVLPFGLNSVPFLFSEIVRPLEKH